LLAGCHRSGPGAQPAPTTPPAAATQAPQPAGLGHSAEGPRARRFTITRQQLAVIGSHLIEVFCRQGLWRYDAGFGVHDEKDPNRVTVLVDPGRSGLTAKQMLDRLLGRG
jgi:hypothetical protein